MYQKKHQTIPQMKVLYGLFLTTPKPNPGPHYKNASQRRNMAPDILGFDSFGYVRNRINRFKA